jgi:capsular polysaccharide biosynthesis protein
MIYHLLKIRAIEYYEAQTGNDVKLIIPPDPPSYITESLNLIGYDDSRYIEWNNEPIRVSQLVVPSFPEPTPRAIQWLRERILPGIKESNTGSEWVYISRQQADKRRVKNFTQVKQVLTERNIKIVELESLPLAEQISILHNAEGVVGPHGAGMVNMIWPKI